jgi:outer membrane protein OmpA-like peptidoglycan-associated protein
MLLGWLIFFLVTWYGCVRPCCVADPGAVSEEPQTEEPAPDPTADPRYPIESQYGLAAVTTNEDEGYAALRERLVREAQSNEILEVTGFYYPGEVAPEGFENMGLARAAEVAKLLDPSIPRDRIQLRARLLGEGQEAPASGALVRAADFSWVEAKPADEGDDEVEVEELEDRIVITFPFRAATKDRVEPEIDDYLTRLAARMQQETDMRVQITGHTDNISSDEFNMRLGQQRADYLKNILVKKGVAADRITTRSRGESQPVASNDTEAGRAENRRAELVILE